MPAITYTRATAVDALPGAAPVLATLRRRRIRTAGQLAAALAAGTVDAPAITRAYATHPPAAVPLGAARAVARRLLRCLRAAHPEMGAFAAVVGSVRRRRPRVGDIDILVSVPCDAIDLAAVVRRAGGEVLAEFASGAARRSCILLTAGTRIALDLFSAPPREWGTALLHHTGSARYNIRVRAHARAAGFSLSQHGLRSLASGRVRRFSTEAAVFAALHITPRPPEARQL
jgi:DNA polymerase/3'-5' exonuclease PolX